MLTESAVPGSSLQRSDDAGAYGDNTIQRFIINHAAILRIQIHAIGTVREGLNTIGQYIFFRVMHFINEAIAQPLTLTLAILPTLK